MSFMIKSSAFALFLTFLEGYFVFVSQMIHFYEIIVLLWSLLKKIFSSKISRTIRISCAVQILFYNILYTVDVLRS